MDDLRVADLLQRLDGPIDPDSRVAEAIWDRIAGAVTALKADVDEPTVAQGKFRPSSATDRRWLAAAVAFGVTALILGLVGWLLRTGTTEPPVLTALTTSTTSADTTRPTLLAAGPDAWVLPVGLHPQDLTTDGRHFFVLATPQPYGPSDPPQETATVMAFDVDGSVIWQRELSDAPIRVIAGEDSLWVAHYGNGALTRLDVGTGAVAASVTPELPPGGELGADNGRFLPADVKVGFGSLWVSTARGAVARISLSNNQIEDVIALTPGAVGQLAVSEQEMWVAESAQGLTRIDPATNEATTLPLDRVGHTADYVAHGGGAVWVVGDRLARNEDDSFRVEAGGYVASEEFQVTALDPESFEILATRQLEAQPVFLGYLNAFFGVLREDRIFHHLTEEPPTIVNSTTVSGLEDGYVAQVEGEAWFIDQLDRRLQMLRETGQALGADLPVVIGDPSGPRPIPDEFVTSPDWVQVDGSPIQPRWPAIVAWTGTELVIWGGETIGGGSYLGDGATYRPDGGGWREMTPDPLSRVDEPSFVWTGAELIVWSGSGAASWTPSSNTWEDLGQTGLRSSFYRRAVWTGEEIIDTLSNGAYSPVPRSSRNISQAPPIHERAQVVWTGDEIVVLPHEGIYDPATDTWRAMASGPLHAAGVDGVWIGERVIAADYNMTAASYDPRADTWTPLPNIPLPFSECRVRLHDVGGVAVADHCSGVAVLDVEARVWVPFAGPSLAAEHDIPLLPAGDQIFAWGRPGFFRFQGSILEPQSETRRYVVGTIHFDVPETWTAAIDPSIANQHLELNTPDGESCLIHHYEGDAATILSGVMPFEPELLPIVPRIGGEPYMTLYVPTGIIDDRDHLFWAPLSTSTIEAVCATPETIRILFEHIIWPWQ